MSQDLAATGPVVEGVRTHATTLALNADAEEADLFALGRQACAARDRLTGGRGSFVRSRRLVGGGTSTAAPGWRGPRDASESQVEETDLPALGGWAAARAAGADVLVGGGRWELHRQAMADGARSVWRFAFAGDAAAGARRTAIASLVALFADHPPFGIIPTPLGEPLGLPTLRLFAELRLMLPDVPHLFAEVATLGPRLGQMVLGFGADAVFAPIVSERALRVGDNARNPAMTRKEATTLLRGAGLVPCERRADGSLEEVTP